MVDFERGATKISVFKGHSVRQLAGKAAGGWVEEAEEARPV